MPFNATTYQPRQTIVHGIDARVKILLVIAYSAALFFVHSWWGFSILALLVCASAYAARIDIAAVLRSLKPVAIILVLTLVVNTFTFNANGLPASFAGDAGFPKLLAEQNPIALADFLYIVPAGFERGVLYAARIVLLILASLVLTTTTTSTEISAALKSFLRPLERIGLPAHDIATVVSIALRFIPVTIDEFQRVRASQTARGAQFDTGGLGGRLKAWATVLLPLFVGLFRRSKHLALALEARCYGAAGATQLNEQQLLPRHALLLIFGLALLTTLGIWA